MAEAQAELATTTRAAMLNSEGTGEQMEKMANTTRALAAALKGPEELLRKLTDLQEKQVAAAKDGVGVRMKGFVDALSFLGDHDAERDRVNSSVPPDIAVLKTKALVLKKHHAHLTKRHANASQSM